MTEIRATMLFEKRRQVFLKDISAKSKGEKKVIPFTNDDVPNFLRAFHKYMEQSKEVQLVVK